MARMLSRSRSLRILRGGHKETHQDANNGAPAQSHAELDRLKATTPGPRAESRLDTPDLSQRPRTSGGPADRGKLFHKKVAPVTPNHADSTSNFPFPSPSKSTTTILYTAEVHEDTGVIGIALGSPTMNPPWNIGSHNENLGTTTYISSNIALPRPDEAKQETPKPKMSRWKSIFGKKPQPPQPTKQTFYQLAQSVVPTRADSHHDDESLESRSISRADDHPEEPQAVSPPVFRPEIRQSRRLPRGVEQPNIETRPRALTNTPAPPSIPKTSLMRSASSPKPHVHEFRKPPTLVPQVVVSNPAPPSRPAPTRSATGPLLDVEIPSVKLDRYSVMFGSLLQSTSTSTSSSNRSSSLLVRRQGNSDRLKPLNELSMKNEEEGSRLKPQRRATSPSHPPKSPAVSLSLFPQPLSVKALSPRPGSSHRRQLRRSKTAPARSPSRPDFPIEPAVDRAAKEVLEVLQPKKLELEKPEPEVEDLNLKSQLLSATPSSRHSFDSDGEDITVMVGASPTAALKPQRNEPQWELVRRPTQKDALRSHPPTAVAAAELTAQGPFSAPLELTRTNKKFKPQTVEPAPLSANQVQASSTAHQSRSQNESQTATVGIARSVSVSRTSPRSADVVGPTLVRRMTEKSLSPASGRFIDQKPLTPTLVELKNRKSQRVQLVDA